MASALQTRGYVVFHRALSGGLPGGALTTFYSSAPFYRFRSRRYDRGVCP